ncbi:MAG: FeoB-associated Cys-rich membrane protein [Thermodesulfobacteriota bacterium]
MTVNFIVGLIVLAVVFFAIYFNQANKPSSTASKETAKKEEPKAPSPSATAKTESPIDPFKSAVPPKD